MGPLSRFLFPDGHAEGARSSEQVSTRRDLQEGVFFLGCFSSVPPLRLFLLGSDGKCEAGWYKSTFFRRAGSLRRVLCALEPCARNKP